MPIYIHQKIAAIFSSRKSSTVIAFNLLLLLFLGWIDWITGDYSLIIFYLIPISIASWVVSRRCGIMFCVLAVLVRIIADESSISVNSAHSTLHYWNELVEFLLLLLMSLLSSALKKSLESEKSQTS